MIYQPLSAFAGDGASPEVSLQRLSGKDECTVQVAMSASASVAIQGRVSAAAPWVELSVVTSDTIQPIAAIPHLRLVVTGNSGTVSAWIRQ